MVQVQQRILVGIATAALLLAPDARARRFYPDDPLWTVPPPVSLQDAKRRKLNEWYDYFHNTFWKPGERVMPGHAVPAGGVNTLGEVPDSPWYTNRHGQQRMSLQALVRGPGNSTPPSLDGPWQVIGAKTEGITPGFRIRDAKGRVYFIKVDPLSNPEMMSAADVIGSKFFYALGYHTPENHIVSFRRSLLTVAPDTQITDRFGKERPMNMRDVTDLLANVPRDREGHYRVVASLAVAGTPIGPFRYYGVRRDDPNDVVPHEHRRDLRGLRVFAAWLNHTDSKSINSLDTLVEDRGIRFIRHHLIDFGAILGSDSFEPKSPRNGNLYLFDWDSSVAQFLTLGLYVPKWARADYPDHLRAVGRFESEVFDPEQWHSNYRNAAFENCQPDDAFWAARQVMAFTNEEIAALVKTGEYSDPRATEYVTHALIGRRDKIGRTYFAKVLPLDGFTIQQGEMRFEDLAVRYGFSPARPYTWQWFAFDNASERKTPLSGASTAAVPLLAEGAYTAAEIRAAGSGHSVTVYVRRHQGQDQVVGIERDW